MKENKLDPSYYLKDLDRKLKHGGQSLQISREWLQGLRLFLEASGVIGHKNLTAIQINLRDGEECPACKQTYYDNVEKIRDATLDDDELANELEAELKKRRGGRIAEQKQATEEG